MQANAILKSLEPIFCDVLDMEKITLRPEMTAADVTGWDSIAHIRLIVAIEQAFNVQFDSDEINSLESVQDLVSLVEKKKAA